MSEHHASYSPDQEIEQIAEQAHVEIARLHEHALAALGQPPRREEAKHALQQDEPPPAPQEGSSGSS